MAQSQRALNHLPAVAADGNACKPNTQVTGLNSVSIITSCMYHCCKRCARKRERGKKHLPQEILAKVLLLLPAQDLNDVMRHVCREWSLMIRSQDFTHDHLRNSNCGLIIQACFAYNKKTFVEMRQGCLEISKFDFRCDDLASCSCNGLLLTVDVRDMHVLNVVNPVTKQQLALPPFLQRLYVADFCGFAFVVASMEYKVVTSYVLSKNIQCAILTIGVDQVWRQIDILHLSSTTRKALRSHPLATEGFVHWFDKTVVLTLNMETENISQFSYPPAGLVEGKFLPMESNLTYVCKSNRGLWDVWEMNPETGVWNKLFSFDLEAHIHRYKDFLGPHTQLVPFGWLVHRELLVFSAPYHHQSICVAYNVKSQEVLSFELDPSEKAYYFEAHVKSLVWFN